ncbi:MAG: CDP-diacylglycerol--glycerol-3-phosphate 3-phosphatidyltransferase [Candidatus Limnocylindria bacterium]
MTTQARPRVTSVPNLLGIARILATPVVIALLLLPFPGAGIIAFVVFSAADATDWLDGKLARARGEVSPLGVFMDLTADKVLVSGVLVAMVEAQLLPTWMVATILIRELVIAGVRQIAAAERVVIAARALGKSKTVTTLLAMAILLLAFDAQTAGPMASLRLEQLLEAAGYWLMVAATILTVVSALDYLRGALPVLFGRTDAGDASA